MGYLYRQKYSAFICIIICLFFSCAPRAKRWGLPQYEYTYQVPEKVDDGWETASLTEAGVNSEIISALMGNILKGNLPNIHSVLLIKNGKLVLEEYFYRYSRETKHLIASDTKSVTSILVGIAIDKQMISDVNKRVYEFFPEYKGTRWIDQKYDITLKHLLTMTAGLDWDEIANPHPHPKNPNTGMYKTDHPIEYILDKRKVAPPGERWNYNSGLTVLLGGIIKNTSGRYADKFAEKYLFGPLGITDYDWYKHPDGTVFTNGDLLLRPRDMAKIGYMMLRKGKWKGKQIVSREWVNESTKAHVARGVWLGRKYGYQWYRGEAVVNNQVIETYFASGTGGQYIFIFPTLDLVVVFTSKIFDNSFGHQRPQAILINYILPAMLPPAPPRKTIELDSTLLDKYVGDYVYQLGKVRKVKLTIYSEGGKIYCKMAEVKFKLFPETERQFFGTIKGLGNIKGSFIEDEKGIVKNLVVDIGISKVEFEKIK